ncbi:ABC transporter permease [Rhodococcus sp. OK302]|uniref:ABC transporter permease n=1 Tax=Rhodococcus sp. OK302 TaxID=1882769 RepID=UPI000B945208|nr:ABC transporter permease [Rhodococcus sp. OK302]OYD69902.1 NitT/TauT family transport system permease protein [Rhodococcus sp. OK302]
MTTSSTQDKAQQLAPVSAVEQVQPAVEKRRRQRSVSPTLTKLLSRRNITILTIQLIVFGGFLAFWEIAVRAGWAREVFYSKPSAIWDQLVEYLSGSEIFLDSVTTISETLLGFGLGAVLGIPVGLLLGRYALFRSVSMPFLTALNSLPRVALAPMFILWFGIGPESKVYLVASVVFFIVMVATESGIRTIDPDFIMMGRAIGSTERGIFLNIVLPASVPSLFSGLKLGAVYALLAAIFGEMLAADNGWGRKIALDSQSFQPAGVFATLVVVVVFALIFNGLMSAAERWLLRWQR